MTDTSFSSREKPHFTPAEALIHPDKETVIKLVPANPETGEGVYFVIDDQKVALADAANHFEKLGLEIVARPAESPHKTPAPVPEPLLAADQAEALPDNKSLSLESSPNVTAEEHAKAEYALNKTQKVLPNDSILIERSTGGTSQFPFLGLARQEGKGVVVKLQYPNSQEAVKSLNRTLELNSTSKFTVTINEGNQPIEAVIVEQTGTGDNTEIIYAYYSTEAEVGKPITKKVPLSDFVQRANIPTITIK